MADNHTIARPYAQALFEVARESGTLEALSASLSVAAELVADDRVTDFLTQPKLSDAQRLEFLTGLFSKAVGEGSVFAGGSQHGSNFLKLLIENGRVGVLAEISERFEILKAEVENSVDVTVTSASELDESQKSTIVVALKARLGRDVRLTTEIDQNLIGGAVIRAGDVVIDGSLRARLEGLTNALVN